MRRKKNLYLSKSETQTAPAKAHCRTSRLGFEPVGKWVSHRTSKTALTNLQSLQDDVLLKDKLCLNVSCSYLKGVQIYTEPSPVEETLRSNYHLYHSLGSHRFVYNFSARKLDYLSPLRVLLKIVHFLS